MNKIQKINSITIIDNRYVVKKENDLTKLEGYLRSRNYEGFIPIEEYKDQKTKYKYLENNTIDKEQLGIDIIDNIALLHNKTSYKKDIGRNKNKEIYDNLNGYVSYLMDYYDDYLTKIEYIEYPSPSNLLFMSNYSKIREVLSFTKKEINNWYNLVKDKTTERVSTIHGNLRLNHAIYNDRLYLCSWNRSHIETPIKDIVNFYKNEWMNLNFKNIIEEYFKKCEILEEEKKLLFINLLIPDIPNTKKTEIDNTYEITKLIQYIYKTEELIRPYYSENNKEKQ